MDGKRENRKKKFFSILYIAIIILIAVIINVFICSPLRIQGDSMNTALRDNDITLINKIGYRLDEPERFDIVVFRSKYDYNTKYVKRIIGLPGETIEIKNDDIYVDTKKLDEFYGIYDESVDINIMDAMGNMEPIVLGEDEYFVLGDNRYHSDDSRSTDVGFINKEDILGKVFFRLYPFDGIGSLKYQ